MSHDFFNVDSAFVVDNICNDAVVVAGEVEDGESVCVVSAWEYIVDFVEVLKLVVFDKFYPCFYAACAVWVAFRVVFKALFRDDPHPASLLQNVINNKFKVLTLGALLIFVTACVVIEPQSYTLSTVSPSPALPGQQVTIYSNLPVTAEVSLGTEFIAISPTQGGLQLTLPEWLVSGTYILSVKTSSSLTPMLTGAIQVMGCFVTDTVAK